MTLYIIVEDKPGIVTRYDNVVEVIANRESQSVYLKQSVLGRYKPHSTKRYEQFTHPVIENVKSIESN